MIPAPRRPLTFWLGLAVIVASEALLAADVILTPRGPVHSDAQIGALPEPQSTFAQLARLAGENITPLAWFGFIIFMEGVLRRGSNPVRRRPHHFATLCLASVPIWCLFDYINFYFIHAWTYIGMPSDWAELLPGYLVAFGSIVPGMLMSGQLLLDRGWFDRARGPAWPMPRWLPPALCALGVLMFVWPFVFPDPITNFALWESLILVLDPINWKLGRPSVLGDLQRGWFGRPLAACAGGLACGLLWEFWNYWALSKWVYHLPFLGAAGKFHYFEMPLPGLVGFVPFGLQCWVMWQTLRIPLDGMVEPLPEDRSLL